MGEYAELALEQELSWYPFDHVDIGAIYNWETQWRTKDNQVLEIADMHPSHIANCVRMLERKGHPVPPLMYHILEKDPF